MRKRWKIRSLLILVGVVALGVAAYRYYDQVLSKKSLNFTERLTYESRLSRTLSNTSDFLKYQAKQLEVSGQAENAAALVALAKRCDVGASYHRTQAGDFTNRGSIPWTSALPDLIDPCPAH